MKIKLNATSDVARRIARCFIEQPCTDGRMFIGFLNNIFVTCDDFMAEEYYEDIVFDLDTVAFDPYAAMREDVIVSAWNEAGCVSDISENHIKLYTPKGYCEWIPIREAKLSVDSYLGVDGVVVTV